MVILGTTDGFHTNSSDTIANLRMKEIKNARVVADRRGCWINKK